MPGTAKVLGRVWHELFFVQTGNIQVQKILSAGYLSDYLLSA